MMKKTETPGNSDVSVFTFDEMDIAKGDAKYKCYAVELFLPKANGKRVLWIILIQVLQNMKAVV